MAVLVCSLEKVKFGDIQFQIFIFRENNLRNEMLRVLLIGLDPKSFDYAKSPFPDLTPESVMVGLQNDLNALNREGYDSKMILLSPDGDSIGVIRQALESQLDVILLGAALRTSPKYFELFEKVINLVHENAPSAKICFNTGPTDSLAAVQRWA